jgi:hypothetical protein
MQSVEPQLTHEQQEENARQAAVSYRWLQKHLDFVMNSWNGQLMAKYILVRNLPWAEASLEEAYNFCRDGFDDSPDPTPATVEPQAAPLDDTPPYGPITKETVRAMDRTEMSKWMRDKKWGKQFVDAINSLKMKKGDLR